MIRWQIRIMAAVTLLNAMVFACASPYFIDEIHHHWIVPVFCAWLLVQATAAVKLPPDWDGPAYRVILALVILTGAILGWRQFSMFQCFRHCEGRLAMGLAALAASLALASGSTAFRHNRAILGLAYLFAVWSGVVALIGFVQGTINFC